jgi:hypothetical protein
MVRMLFSDGPNDTFREIFRVPHFGTEDLAHLRFEVIDSGEPGNPVDARLIDLRVRADRFSGPARAADPGAPAAEPGRKTGGKGWLAAALLVGLALVVMAALGVALRRYALARRFVLIGGAFVAVAALALAIGYVATNRDPEPPPAPGQDVYRSLKGEAEHREAFERRGPNAEQCVRFEPEGLRITLPPGFPMQRPMIGVGTDLPIQGDFEITVNFQILNEPDQADGVHPAMKLWLAGVVDNEHDNPVVVGRIIAKTGEPRYTMWQTLWDKQARKNHTHGEQVPTQAKFGRLRLVRSGTVVRFYAADGDNADFALLQEFPFTEEPLKSVQLLCSTGGVQSAVDARFTDLRIRAGSALKAADTQPTSGLGWPLALATGLLAVTVAGTGIWWYRRRRVAPAAEPVTEAPRVALRCSACERKLKVKAELAGKKVKCPQCGAAIPVPQPSGAA